jgi:hypothetical protein
MPGLTWSLARRVVGVLALVFAVAFALLAPPVPARAEQTAIELTVPYRGQLDGSLGAGATAARPRWRWCWPATARRVDRRPADDGQ